MLICTSHTKQWWKRVDAITFSTRDINTKCFYCGTRGTRHPVRGAGVEAQQMDKEYSEKYWMQVSQASATKILDTWRGGGTFPDAQSPEHPKSCRADQEPGTRQWGSSCRLQESVSSEKNVARSSHMPEKLVSNKKDSAEHGCRSGHKSEQRKSVSSNRNAARSHHKPEKHKSVFAKDSGKSQVGEAGVSVLRQGRSQLKSQAREVSVCHQGLGRVKPQIREAGVGVLRQGCRQVEPQASICWQRLRRVWLQVRLQVGKVEVSVLWRESSRVTPQAWKVCDCQGLWWGRSRCPQTVTKLAVSSDSDGIGPVIMDISKENIESFFVSKFNIGLLKINECPQTVTKLAP